jgi:hypothetical protein
MKDPIMSENGRTQTWVPSLPALEKLSEYANLLAKFGANSFEAEAFYWANMNLPNFAENARDLKRLQHDDEELLGGSSGRGSIT